MAKTKSKDLTSLSDDDFMEAWDKASAEAQEMRERLMEFSHEHQRRARKAQLTRMADLSEADLALLQEVVAEGVESKEAVGDNG